MSIFQLLACRPYTTLESIYAFYGHSLVINEFLIGQVSISICVSFYSLFFFFFELIYNVKWKLNSMFIPWSYASVVLEFMGISYYEGFSSPVRENYCI